MKKTRTRSFGTTARLSHDASSFYNSKLYHTLKQPKGLASAMTQNVFPIDLKNQLLLGDARNMKEIPDDSVALVITSPPYNVSKEYDNDLSLEEYFQFLREAFREVFRVLMHGGRVCVNIANVGRKPYIPLSDYFSQMMITLGFFMRGEVIWNKGSGAGVSTAWGSWQSASNPTLRDTHEYILIFSKGDYKRQKTFEGQNTITKNDFIEWTKSVWTINTASAKKIGHPAPFPMELPYRLIQLYSFTKDVILDPFMGSGTTALASIRSGRYYLGYEDSPQYVDLSRERLRCYQEKNVLLEGL